MSMGASDCENCGSPQFRRLYSSHDYVSGERFEIVQCRLCGLVRSLLPGSEFDHDRYYDTAYYGDQGRRFPDAIEWLVHAFRRHRARFVQSQHPSPGRILDIGCGRGWMLAELQRRGWACVGTEAARELAAALERRDGIRVRVATDIRGEFPPASFDVITIWHVLEHMQAPVATLGEVHRLLRPGGMVVVETPNIDSLQSRLGRGRWFHLDAPRHRYHFSASSLSSIFEKQGFRVTSLDTFSLEYGLYGFIQTLLNFITRQPNLLFARLQAGRPPEANPSRPGRALDDLLAALALPLAVVLGTISELIGAVIGRGSVIRLTAIRCDRAEP